MKLSLSKNLIVDGKMDDLREGDEMKRSSPYSAELLVNVGVEMEKERSVSERVKKIPPPLPPFPLNSSL